MLDFHSHFETECSIVNNSLLLPQNYSEENKEKALSESTWHLGEIGLDSRYTDIMSLEKQVEIFTFLLEYAKKEDKAVSVHSVHAVKLTVDLLQKAGLKPWKVLWHGYNGSKETAAQLYKIGVIISLGPKFKGSFKDIIKANPMYVLETDYEGKSAEEHSEILYNLYKKVSEETGLSVEQLEEHCNAVEKAFKN